MVSTLMTSAPVPLVMMVTEPLPCVLSTVNTLPLRRRCRG